ncbi:uncharacterized protein TRIADDRAFT_56506 [Trichoplax adhaerens]|uniref:Uncharacterized protein n=1 Tax=Trichoplax adhaerens TaxID=10228 RepID=B3RYC1_TRIAD|nr:hypothetical protein TRIADDRAFT_56506 [Trichoplax adhaerens]EDV24573.1 hypothetical protein TRIADDRAFT_56506 [Trichoplax adhaerens]|eukprot:XP_002112463.1 hypothetical protein TRIADDRAFT_56506 [Trichoplax adhaerens]
MLSSTEGDQRMPFYYQSPHQHLQPPAMRHPGYTEIIRFQSYDDHGIRAGRHTTNHGNLQIRQDHGYPNYPSEQAQYFNNAPRFIRKQSADKRSNQKYKDQYLKVNRMQSSTGKDGIQSNHQLKKNTNEQQRTTSPDSGIVERCSPTYDQTSSKSEQCDSSTNAERLFINDATSQAVTMKAVSLGDRDKIVSHTDVECINSDQFYDGNHKDNDKVPVETIHKSSNINYKMHVTPSNADDLLDAVSVQLKDAEHTFNDKNVAPQIMCGCESLEDVKNHAASRVYLADADKIVTNKDQNIEHVGVSTERDCDKSEKENMNLDNNKQDLNECIQDSVKKIKKNINKKIRNPETHQLYCNWCFWYDCPSRGNVKPVKQDSTSYQDSLNIINVITTKGIKPMWEDKANQDGGKWVMTIGQSHPDLVNNLWNELLMALVGGHFEYNDEICGAVLSRRREDKIALWTKRSGADTINLLIGKQFVKTLAYATGLEKMMESFLCELSGGFLRDIRIDYLIHKDSVKTGTSYMNRQHATKLSIIEGMSKDLRN